MREQTSRPDRPYESWITEEVHQKKLEYLQPAQTEKHIDHPHITRVIDLPRLMDRPDKKPM